jgi:hypothetical protein
MKEPRFEASSRFWGWREAEGLKWLRMAEKGLKINLKVL